MFEGTVPYPDHIICRHGTCPIPPFCIVCSKGQTPAGTGAAKKQGDHLAPGGGEEKDAVQDEISIVLWIIESTEVCHDRTGKSGPEFLSKIICDIFCVPRER